MLDQSDSYSTSSSLELEWQFLKKMFCGFNLSSTITSIKYDTFHDLVQKTTFKPKACLVCLKQIKFSVPVVKCIDCQLHCHPRCEKYLAILCHGPQQKAGCYDVNRSMNQIDHKSTKFTYPNTHPFIPYPIICLINEIELKLAPGIYCLPTYHKNDEPTMQKILMNFRQNKAQHLKRHNVHVLANCLKIVFQELQDGPLIRHWNLTRNCSNNALRLEIGSLPIPIRNVLALLLVHLQFVSAHNQSRMSLKSLAIIFAPILIEKEIFQLSNERNDNYEIQKLEHNLILELLEMDSRHFLNFLNLNTSAKK